jgi:hypothetical protein
LARAEHHGHEIDDDLVDEAESQCPAPDLAGGDIDDPVAGEVLGGADGRLDAVDERERRGAGRSWVTNEDVVAGRGLAAPAVRQVEHPPPDDDGSDVRVLGARSPSR